MEEMRRMEKFEDIKRSIDGLSREEKAEFFSAIVPGLCYSSLDQATCRAIFEKEVSGGYSGPHTVGGGARRVG